MASGWYTNGLLQCMNGAIDLDTTSLRLMLVDTVYTYNPDHTVVDDGTTNATCLKAKEITATNYVPGYGSGSRNTPTITMQANATANRFEAALTDWVIAALGGAVNATIGGVALIKEGGANDTTSVPIAFFDLSAAGPGGGALTTNGSPVTVDFATLGAGGNLQIAV
jgi:N-methylhydantoinase B/oxoprolinase/acetone carboxylase alpha subunit